jgi:menaquinone-dependent protoporphyrinogen oxidase
MTRLLVAYATRHGSTQGVAERIGARLRESGAGAEVRPVDGPDLLDIDGYDAVVLGSPVYNQHWLPEADRFAEAHAESLAALPLWLFSVGTFGDTKPLIGGLMKREPHNIADLSAHLAPREYRVFAGVIDRHQWPFLSRLFYHSLGGGLGDNRDWDEIDRWARRIAQELRVSTDIPAG